MNEQEFHDRVQQWKKDNLKNMTLSDQLEFRNPATVADCAQSIYENMRFEEDRNMVDPEYL